MTYREAFTAMQGFLEKYYEETKSDDVGSLLGELSFDIWEGGATTGDPACWGEWVQCINKVTKNEKKLTYLEAFQCMREFLELYYRNTKSDDVGDILSATQLSIWADGGTADPACWGEWIQCIDKVTKNEKG